MDGGGAAPGGGLRTAGSPQAGAGSSPDATSTSPGGAAFLNAGADKTSPGVEAHLLADTGAILAVRSVLRGQP